MPINHPDVFLTLQCTAYIGTNLLERTLEIPSSADINTFHGPSYIQIIKMSMRDWTFSSSVRKQEGVYVFLSGPNMMYSYNTDKRNTMIRNLGLVKAEDKSFFEDDGTGTGTLVVVENTTTFSQTDFPPRIINFNGEDITISIRDVEGNSFASADEIGLDNGLSEWNIELRITPLDQSKFRALRGDKS